MSEYIPAFPSTQEKNHAALSLARDLVRYRDIFHKFGPSWGNIASDFDRLAKQAGLFCTTSERILDTRGD